MITRGPVRFERELVSLTQFLEEEDGQQREVPDFSNDPLHILICEEDEHDDLYYFNAATHINTGTHQ